MAYPSTLKVRTDEGIGQRRAENQSTRDGVESSTNRNSEELDQRKTDTNQKRANDKLEVLEPPLGHPRSADTSYSRQGTGGQYVESTGLAADGGNFDATKPGAGREANSKSSNFFSGPCIMNQHFNAS